MCVAGRVCVLRVVFLYWLSESWKDYMKFSIKESEQRSWFLTQKAEAYLFGVRATVPA